MAGIDPTNGLATDARSLERLKADARRDPASATSAAATQFEALFMQSLLKSMRGAIQKSGLTDSAQTEHYTAMLDQQLAQKLAGRPGGLSEIIARQLSRNIGSGGSAAATAANAAATAGAASAELVGAQAPGAGSDHPVGEGDGLAVGGLPAAAGAGVGGVAGSVAGVGGIAGPAGSRADVASLRAALASLRADAAAGQSGRDVRGNGDAVRAIDLYRADPAQASPAVQAAAAAALADEIRNDAGAAAQARFVKAIWPHALAAQRQTGTAAHLVVGQAALKSGWGRHEIVHPDGRPSHNLFGIKAGRGWQGKTVEATTTEFVDGKPLRLVQRFRAYDSYAEAFRDWSRLMNDNERYDGVMKAGQDPGRYAREMQDAGYATDPAYADKLEKTIRRTIALRRLVI